MIIASKTSANSLLSTPTTINPQFFGVSITSAPSTSVIQQVTATPPPYTQSVFIQPPDYTEEVTLTPPPYIDRSGQVVPVPTVKKTITITSAPVTQNITFQPPDVSFQKIVSSAGVSSVSNLYGAVGIVQLTPLRLVALVRPNIVAGALHYALPVGTSVRFIGSNGYEDRFISKVAFTNGDLQLYYLDQSVSVVKPVPICISATASALANRNIVTFGLIGSRTGDGSGWVPAAATNKVARVMVDATAGTWNATCSMLTFQLEPGDSGSPTFVVEDSGPTFLGSTRKISSTYEINVAAPSAVAINSL